MAKVDIYSDAAYFGRFMVNVSAILSIIASVVLLIAGVAMLFQRDVHSYETVGTIAKVDCKPLQNGKLRCSLLVNYVVNGKMLQLQEEVDTSKAYTLGSQLSVYFDPDRPEDAVATELTPKQFGIRLIIASVILFLITGVIVWLSRKYKFFSAAYGVGEVASLII